MGGIAEGGGIAARFGAHLTLIDTTVSGNRTLANATGTQPGGITEGGGLSIRESSLTMFGGAVEGNLVESSGASGGIAGGGGVHYRGEAGTTLTLEDLSVSDNRAVSNASEATGNGDEAQGAGIDLYEGTGPVTLADVTIAGNTASATGGSSGAGGFTVGGGLEDRLSPTTLTDATIAANSITSNGAQAGAGSGGGINAGGGLVTLLNSTVDANSATATGTPAGPVTGGNIFVSSPGLHAKNSIVTGGVANEPTSQNCGGGSEVLSEGHNIDSTNECGFHGTGDQVNTNPLLGALESNGGPVQTMALLSGSPAIDAGDDSGCPGRDARGVVRPQGPACDIGAYERAPATAVTGGAANISSTGATLSGLAANPDALAGSVTFQFGPTTAYGSTTAPQGIAAAAAGASFTASVTGLAPGTTYHFREVVTNAAGVAVGADQTLTTVPGPAKPTVRLSGQGRSASGGNAILFTVACAAGAPCPITAVASTTEKLRGKRVVSLSKRQRRRTVTVGSLTVTVGAGKTKTLTLRLNALGRRLERRFGRLPVTLTITVALPGNAHELTSRTHLTLRPPRKRHG